MSAYHDIEQVRNQLREMLPQVSSLRDDNRAKPEIGRNLALCFTHLEDALHRADLAQQWSLHDLMSDQRAMYRQVDPPEQQSQGETDDGGRPNAS